MAKAVLVVHDLLDTLPFHDVLTWEKFQALCTDVLFKTFRSVDSREYLNKGNQQHGIDVYAVHKGEEKITVAQCKLKEYIGPKEVADIIDDFLKGKIAKETREFILCTSADLGRQRDEEATISNARKKLAPFGIDLVVWDERGLSKELRTNPSPEIINIVYRYFDDTIALKFYGHIWIDYLKKLRKVEKRKYNLPQDHIERKVETYTGQSRKEGAWYDCDKTGKTLVQVLEQTNETINKKVVLLSTAGFGKTQELENLAGYFSPEEKMHYPIKFSLRNYGGQLIQDILHTYNNNWQNIDQENILLILDGLDEIGEIHADTFFRNLNAFVEQHQKIKAVVSSRFNFYDVQHPRLKGFDIYLLNPLNQYDIETYLQKKLGNQKDNFKQILRDRNFTEYENNPYYLTRLVRFYKDRYSLPKNKSEFFQRVLFERLTKDEGVHQIPELKEKLLPLARQIAFCMTMSGKSDLTDDEMKTIVPDNDSRRLLKHFGVINRNATTLGSSSFEHKNLQEYLCASVLSESSFPTIQSLITYKYDSNKMLPRYLNTISFLFELIDRNSDLFQKLFNWMNTNEPEALVNFEREQLFKETRHSIFKKIFQHYKKLGLTIRASGHFSHEELARFTEFDDDLINYLYNQMEPSLPDSLVYDTIYLLEQCARPYLYRESLTRFLYSIVSNNGYANNIRANAFMAFAIFKFSDKEIFETILKSGFDLNSYEFRKAGIFFMDNTEYFEDYSQFILQSIPILEEGQRRSSSSGMLYSLKNLVMKFTGTKAIKEIFQYCITDNDVLNSYSHLRNFHFELNEVQTLLQRATFVYKTDPSILPLVYRIYCGFKYISVQREWFPPFKAFFEQTCGTRVIFKKFYKYDKRERDIMLFADQWCCDFLVEEYRKGKISENEMKVFRNVLSHLNWNLFLYFYEQLKTLNGGCFIIDDLMVDYTALRQQQEEKNQHMLIDQNLFLEEAEYLFKIIAKENITTEDVWFSENKELKKFQESIVIEAIRDLCIHDDDKIITKEQFFEKFENKDEWEGFVIDTTFTLIKDKKAEVHPELLTRLKQWCRHKIEILNFENTVRDNEHSFTCNNFVEFVKDVFLLVDLDLEDQLLLKMLPSDYETYYGWDSEETKTLSSVIINKVQDKDLLQTTVLKNIKGGTLAVRVLCTHFIICHRLHYKESLPYLYQAINAHPLLDEYDKKKLTEFYLELGGEIIDFTDHLHVPFIETEDAADISWQWYLIEKLQFIKREKVTDILLEILQSNHPDPNKLKAAEHLIQLSQIEGLEYWAAYVKEKNVFPFEDKWANFQNYLTHMPTERSIKLFLSVLEFAYKNNLQDRFRGSYYVEESIYSSLITLSKSNHKYYSIIKSRITEMINQFTSEPFVHSIKFHSERFTQRFYESQIQQVDVQQANLIYLESFQ